MTLTGTKGLELRSGICGGLRERRQDWPAARFVASVAVGTSRDRERVVSVSREFGAAIRRGGGRRVLCRHVLRSVVARQRGDLRIAERFGDGGHHGVGSRSLAIVE